MCTWRYAACRTQLIKQPKRVVLPYQVGMVLEGQEIHGGHSWVTGTVEYVQPCS